jgi:hypothetical protein
MNDITKLNNCFFNLKKNHWAEPAMDYITGLAARLPVKNEPWELWVFSFGNRAGTNVEFHDDIDNRVVSVEGKFTHRSLRRPLRCHRPRDVRLFRFMITLTSSFTRTRSPARLQPACHVRPCSVSPGRWRGSRGVRHWLTGGRIHVRARAVQVPGAPVPELTFAALFVGRTLGVSFLRASSSSSRVCSRLPHALAFPLKLLPFFNCSQRSPSLVQVTHMHLLQPLFFSAQAPVTGVSFSDSSRLKLLLVFVF